MKHTSLVKRLNNLNINVLNAENIEEMRKEELRRILFHNLLNFRY